MKKTETPANDLIEKAVIVKHWQSDLAFFHDEISFLITLLDSYLKWLMIDENIERTRIIANHVVTTSTHRKELAQQLENHLSAISKCIGEYSLEREKRIMGEHARLEEVVSGFVKDFRDVKREVFSLTEKVMDSERNPLLLDKQ